MDVVKKVFGWVWDVVLDFWALLKRRKYIAIISATIAIGIGGVYGLDISDKNGVLAGVGSGLLVGVGGFLFVLFVLLEFFEEERIPYVSEPEGATTATAEQLRQANLLKYPGIYLGYTREETKEGVTHPDIYYKGENHLITCGKPASGKGSTVIIPNLLDYDGSCFVIDPKGQNAAITERCRRIGMEQEVFCLNPFGLFVDRLGAPARFNPLDKIKPDSSNFVGDIGSLVDALIYQTGGDSHWADSARELVGALIMHVCRTCESDKRTLGHVRALLTQPLEGFLQTLLEMAGSDFSPLAQKAAQFCEATDEIKSVVSSARTQLAFLDDPSISASLAASDFDFADMKRKKITVFLILPAKHLRAQSRWLRLLITSAIDALTDEPRKGDGRVLFILDEFAQLGKLEAIEKALALVRGYGVQLWPFIQDLPQLQSVYPDRWESFLATAGVVQFFTPNDKTTADYISERCGKRIVTRWSSSSSSTSGHSDSSSSSSSTSGSSKSEHWEPLYHPWELYGSRFGSWKQMIFFEGLSPVASLWREHYYNSEYYTKRTDSDPYHTS